MTLAHSINVHPDIKKVLIEPDRLQARILELGRQISQDYAGRHVVLISILRGSVIFLSDLMRALTLECSVDFISLSSYSGRQSTGQVQLLLDLRGSAEGKDLLVVEDIIDTGLTLRYLLDTLRPRKPRSLESCVLLDKPSCRKTDVKAKYVGFSIPDEFVVGFGLDYNEKYRNLPYVGILKEGVA